jgi:filamentous hemagglutinin
VLIGLALAFLRNTSAATPQPAQANPGIHIAADAPAHHDADTHLATPTARLSSTKTQRPTRTPRPQVTRQVSNVVDGWVIRNVRIYDLDGNLVYRGDVNLKPTIDRITAGISDPHRNDGSTFGNFERRLPIKPRGYYTEYVVRTRGLSGVGPQRLILGRNNEVYYTPDHYTTFVRVK